MLGMAYRNRWNSNDQIPRRAVDEGIVSRFGQVDPTDGGNSQRYSLSGMWRQISGSVVRDADLFAIYSDLTLFSNFTYFLNDPVRGEQFSQRDHRITMAGTPDIARKSSRSAQRIS